jgi:CheY-like chemotaxis protein
MSSRQHFHILCVDDDSVVLEWLRTTLDTFGYDVEVARNGFTALFKVNKNLQRFGIITIDLRLPGMDGFTVIEECRNAGFDGKFLVYAASTTSEAHDRLRSLRVHRVIEKPVPRGNIIEAIREVQSGF